MVSPHSARLIFLGNRGGFSGARLWCVEAEARPCLLRAWPPDRMTAARLQNIHRLMQSARRAGLAFVPGVHPTLDATTWVEHAGRLWDLTTWMSGRADFHDRPTPARLAAACQALASLHAAWSNEAARRGSCPAVKRRLDCAHEWLALVGTGWRPQFPAADDNPVDDWAQRAWRLLEGRVEQIPSRLTPWLDRDVPLQPCLCDIWHDHVLFEAETVTALVDYGSVKIDHVAVDLARLLGSLVGDDPAQRAAGLTAYGRLRPLQQIEEALITALDETGTVLGAANWLRWLYREGRPFEDWSAVAARLAAIVRRIETW
jgi:Ser/Thr protein kinase RdoA (MazF antagonist)